LKTASISGHAIAPGARYNGEITIKCDDGSGEHVLETQTKWDGSYEFKGLVIGDDVASKKYNITVAVRGYTAQTKEIEISKDDDRANIVDFELSEAKGTCSISGHVYDAETGLPIKEGHVSLVIPTGNKYSELDSNGHYEFMGLSANTYEIWAVPTPRNYYINKKMTVMLVEGKQETQDFVLEIAPEINADERGSFHY